MTRNSCRIISDICSVDGDRLEAVRRICKYPESPYEVAVFFAAAFDDRIDFTEQAFDSLQRCESGPAILWDGFYELCNPVWGACVGGQSFDKPDVIWKAGDFTIFGLHKTATQTSTRLQMKPAYVLKIGRSEMPIYSVLWRGLIESDHFMRVYFGYDKVGKRIIVDDVWHRR